jgi:hypothetical protein
MGLAAWIMAALAGWAAAVWPPAIAILALLLACSSLLVLIGLRPAIEVREKHLVIGNRAIPWGEIRRVDRTAWRSPLLVVRLTLSDDSRVLILYPGDPETSSRLLRQIRRSARQAHLDGRPYHEFWGEPPDAGAERCRMAPPRFRLLRPEDEAEVEMLYQRLKTVGRLDSKSSSDET